ncbi:PH domain-containing protein [Nocardioides campestrisoli]|uniref:PH domain-containing protein n=1 Tax=Nocardioides campestrisoli TaxID=2736757 RepID=UPI0015E6B13E|nr:PH domain-containing protein [Nocardioides campestrisoli]
MPAGSDPTLPRTWRPLGVRLAATACGVLLVVVCTFAWFGFDESIRAKFTLFQKSTIFVLAAMVLSVGHALARSRVVAREDGLLVVNGYRRRHFTWPEVIAVRMPQGAPWASLDLSDGTSVAVMGIQGSDGARATAAVRELRGYLDR